MPYHKEFATNKGNQKLLSSTGIKEMLQVVQFIISDNEYDRIDDFIVKEIETPDADKIKYVFVIDGSKFETEVTEGSDAKICLFNINQCAIDIKKLLTYLKEKFPLPKSYKEIKKDVTVSSFLPLKGMRTHEHPDEKDFFRSTLFNVLKRLENPMVDWLKERNYKVEKKQSILDTYLGLLEHVDAIKNVPHPCMDCRRSSRVLSVKSFKKEEGGWLSDIHCKCEQNSKVLYPTDLLGFHEQLNNETSNEALTTQIMLVLEKLTLINLLHLIIENNHIELIEKGVFLLDGSLAVYSHASWLSGTLTKEIIELKSKYPVLIIGIEKTGNFVDFFKKIDSHFGVDPLKNGMLYFLEENYIKNHIKVQDSATFYGENNYFGKKLFYKNKKGLLFVMNVAFEDEADRVADLYERNTDKYRSKVTRLNDIVMLLDNFSSQSYENALSLVSLANEGAALSSSYIGKKLLNEFVQEMVKK